MKGTTKDIWVSMKKKYKGFARVKCAHFQALRKDFESLHMKNEESFTDYFARTMRIASKMCIHKDKLGDISIVEEILRSVSSKFDYIVCSIVELHDIDELSIGKCQRSLSVHK